MTAYVAAFGAAVALALIVDAAVRAREERAWRRDQDVCERVVTGVQTVTREIPDPDAPPVPTITVTEEVERFEWRCPESLLGDREAVSR